MPEESFILTLNAVPDYTTGIFVRTINADAQKHEHTIVGSPQGHNSTRALLVCAEAQVDVPSPSVRVQASILGRGSQEEVGSIETDLLLSSMQHTTAAPGNDHPLISDTVTLDSHVVI
jgi:hypothetical protein